MLLLLCQECGESKAASENQPGRLMPFGLILTHTVCGTMGGEAILFTGSILCAVLCFAFWKRPLNMPQYILLK